MDGPSSITVKHPNQKITLCLRQGIRNLPKIMFCLRLCVFTWSRQPQVSFVSFQLDSVTHTLPLSTQQGLSVWHWRGGSRIDVWPFSHCLPRTLPSFCLLAGVLLPHTAANPNCSSSNVYPAFPFFNSAQKIFSGKYPNFLNAVIGDVTSSTSAGNDTPAAYRILNFSDWRRKDAASVGSAAPSPCTELILCTLKGPRWGW